MSREIWSRRRGIELAIATYKVAVIPFNYIGDILKTEPLLVFESSLQHYQCRVLPHKL